ncbi:hypothetical protein D3C81_2303970 [compost metagenome]
MGMRPRFQQVELAFAAATGQVVAARLQQHLARLAERHGGVGAIDFFFDDNILAGQPL